MAPRPAMTRDDVERGYNNRAAVPEHPYWLDRFATQSRDAALSLSPTLDIRYGSGPKETLDLFVPADPARGTLLFIHGGYWRALDKADHSFVAPPFVAAGHRRRRHQLRPLPGRDDRDDRRAMPPCGHVGRARRAATRCAARRWSSQDIRPAVIWRR